MNNLSWLLYLADVLPTASGWLTGLCSFTLVLSTFLFFAFGMTGFFGEEQKYLSNPKYWSEFAFTAAFARRCRKLWVVMTAAVLVIVGCLLIPSKETFYLIAASQTGEEVLKTPEAAKIRTALNKYLDDFNKPQDAEGNE